ncbi:MAG TPA: TMEM175 family protein [Rhodoblastus sp.]|nr:TMEM175 family protein [Rhodoblastus sp.]
MADDANLFEMRRLEQLSNTVFGVAMTLLAYDLPRAVTFSAAPGWSALLDAYERPLIALALSFMIAGVFWISHHRRLARAPYASRGVVTLNIIFLMGIVALPATNGLYGAHRASTPVSVVYFAHITLLAALNALLWLLARRSGDGLLLLISFIPVALGLASIAIAFVDPAYAPYPMLLAFAAPLIAWRPTPN